MVKPKSDLLKNIEQYQYGFKDPEKYFFKSHKGLNPEIVREISSHKNEPVWMLDFRLKALEHFLKIPMPDWGVDLSDLDMDDLFYYIKPTKQEGKTWDDVPVNIKKTFNRLGIPEAEHKFLAGVGAQYESEMVYHNIQDQLNKKGVIFLSIEEGLRLHPGLFREYFGKAVPYTDNKFAALNSAVWSGGSFVYIPPGVKVDLPLQAYFRLNSASIGQFERSIIIADEGSRVHYVEGCTAPQYSRSSLHSGVIEIFVKKNARVRYTTIQNWSTNVFNLVTQRAYVYQDATMEWVDCNLGSRATMKYPACYLLESGAHGEILSMAFAGTGQQQDSGGKMLHLAPHTTSKINSKSISRGGGRSSFRGLVHVEEKAIDSRANVACDALILDAQSRSDTYPKLDIQEKQVRVGHEASVSKIDEEQLFYLKSRGLNTDEATTMVVSGFIEPLVKELPMEYAVEMNRLIQLQMEGSVG